jgi:hypothetical protein
MASSQQADTRHREHSSHARFGESAGYYKAKDYFFTLIQETSLMHGTLLHSRRGP